MKYINYCALFDDCAYDYAVFVTFNFDPLFFENCILRSHALEHARRIFIFMDAGQYRKMMQSEVLPKRINARYLVLPVQKSIGVFHPKINLLLNSNEARVYCGSANLTQTGCTSNLELVNNIVIKFEPGHNSLRYAGILQTIIEFFKDIAATQSSEPFTFAKGWMQEIESYISPEIFAHADESIKLEHTLSSRLWPKVLAAIGSEKPLCISIISPYFDEDLELLKRFRSQWPKCTLHLYAQSKTCNLHGTLLKKIPNVILHNIESPERRRLHAKLICIQMQKHSLYITGSPNLTTAAFDGINTEAALFIKDMSRISIDDLFDKTITCSLIKASDFEYALIDPPVNQYDDDGGDVLRVESALLDSENSLRVVFSILEDNELEKVDLALKRFGEDNPFRLLSITPKKAVHASKIFSLGENIASQIQTSVQCYLVAKLAGKRVSGRPFWLIQENNLYYERSESDPSHHKEKQIAESGQGLTEHIEHLYATEGYKAVIEFLNRMNIRFHNDETIRFGGGGFTRHGGRDPNLPDDAPDWVFEIKGDHKQEIENAIYDFVQRHRARVLSRHVTKGNVNGIENFLDVFVACNKLMYKHCVRGVLTQQRFVGWICDNIIFLEDFMNAICTNLNNDHELIENTFSEAHLLEHLYAALFMAQMIRKLYNLEPTKATNLLLEDARNVEDARAHCKLRRPSIVRIMSVIKEYSIINDVESEQWLQEFTDSHSIVLPSKENPLNISSPKNSFVPFDA